MLLPIAAMLATGCSKDKNGLKEADNGVRFTSNIPAITATPRATDDGKWESGDKIGVFMMPAGQGITKALPKTNAMYSAQAAGTNTSEFTATGNDLLSYPSSGNVDFIAYHPYKTDLTGTTIDIDVKASPIDYLYTKQPTANVAKTAQKVTLNFNYVLPIVRFEFTDDAGNVVNAADITNLVVKELRYKGTLDLANGTLSVANEQSNLSVTANKLLLVPQTAKVVLTFTYKGKNYTWNAADNFTFAEATAYTFKAKLLGEKVVTVGAVTGVINGRKPVDGNSTPDELSPDGSTPVVTPITLSINPTSLSFKAEGETKTVTVTTNATSFEVNGTVAGFTATANVATKTISVTADANSATSARNGSFNVTYTDENNAVKTVTLAVSQEAKAQATSGELMFCAYAEGSGMNKFLQIYNPTSETIDLSAYTIHMESYGSKNNRSETNDGKLQLSGTLAPGAVLVFRNSEAVAAITATNIIDDDKICNFNGNDPIGLLKNGTVIDVIGPYGKGTTTNFAKDKTLHRKGNQPATEYNVADWKVLSKDDTSVFGKR